MQNCPFHDALQDNPLKLGNYRCDKIKTLLTDCDLIINLGETDYEEHKVVLLRAGLNPDIFDRQLEICIAHRDILGKSFNRYIYTENCRHRGHFDKENTKIDYRGTHISYPEALAALRENLKLPLNMPICKQCYDSVSEKIGTLPMETETEPNFVSPESSESLADPLSLEILSEEIDFIPLTRPVTRAHPQEQPVLQDQPMIEFEPFLPEPPEPPALGASETMPDQDRKQHKQKMEALNNFMKVWGLEEFPNRQHFKNVRFEDCKDPGRQKKVLKAVARACAAVLKTATEQDGSDCIAMLNQLKNSGLIEKELGFEPEMSRELQQHVQLYNRAPDYAARIQICAILFAIYKFCEVNRFNKRFQKSVVGEEESDIDISKLENDGKYWYPPLSDYIWKKAGVHSLNGALEKVLRQPVVRWKFNLECMQTIQAFVMHPNITQRVAFGTRWVPNPYGGKTEIAGVYRTTHNADLATQIAEHLVEQGVKGHHPKERTICAMLEKMPASKTKSLEVRNKDTKCFLLLP